MVRLGVYDRNADNEPGRQYLDVDQTFLQPGYDEFGRHNNIGLIRMVGSAQFNQYVRPACLLDTNSAATARATLTGWPYDFGSSTTTLTKVPVDLLPQEECLQQYRNAFGSSHLVDGIIEDTLFCARTIRKSECVRNSFEYNSQVHF